MREQGITVFLTTQYLEEAPLAERANRRVGAHFGRAERRNAWRRHDREAIERGILLVPERRVDPRPCKGRKQNADVIFDASHAPRAPVDDGNTHLDGFVDEVAVSHGPVVVSQHRAVRALRQTARAEDIIGRDLE